MSGRLQWIFFCLNMVLTSLFRDKLYCRIFQTLGWPQTNSIEVYYVFCCCHRFAMLWSPWPHYTSFGCNPLPLWNSRIVMWIRKSPEGWLISILSELSVKKHLDRARYYDFIQLYVPEDYFCISGCAWAPRQGCTKTLREADWFFFSYDISQSYLSKHTHAQCTRHYHGLGEKKNTPVYCVTGRRK